MIGLFEWSRALIARIVSAVAVGTWDVQQGKRYRVRAIVQKPRSELSDGGRTLIAAALQNAGFSDVAVYLNQDALPAGWGESGIRTPAPPRFNAWAEATWTQPDATIPIDFGAGFILAWTGDAPAASTGATMTTDSAVVPQAPKVVLTQDHSWGFYQGLDAIAKRHGWTNGAIGMLMVMQSEAEMKHDPAHNGPARGIIQFEPDILRDLGWTHSPDEFALLSAEQQLPWVEAYYASKPGMPADPDPVAFYVANFTPAFLSRANDPMAILCDERDPNTARFVHDNPIFVETTDDGFRVIRVRGLGKRLLAAAQGARWKEAVARLAWVEGGGAAWTFGRVLKVAGMGVGIGAIAAALYYAYVQA